MRNSLLNTLNSLDWFVFIFILGLTILMVLRAEFKQGNKSHNIADHLLMARKLTLIPFIMTLVATWYGGIFGTAQIAFESGIFNFITQGLFWYITYFIFAKFIIPKIRANQYTTLPDMLGKTIGLKAKKISAIFNIINLIPIAYTIGLGLLIELMFQIPFVWAMLIGVFFVCSYAAVGGLRAIVISDMIQFFVMLASVIILFLFSVMHFGLNPLKTLPDHYFSFFGEYSFAQTIIWGFIAISTLIDPNFYQRSFAAQNTKTAQVGVYFSIIIWIIFDLSLTFGAMYAKALLPLASASTGYFEYALSVLPQGMRGFFLSGIVATLLSTLDSYLFLASSTMIFDLFPKYKNSKAHYILSFFIIGLLSVLIAIYFKGNIKEVWKTLGSLSSACLLVPVILNIFSKEKMRDNEFFKIVLISAISVILFRLFSLNIILDIEEFYIGFIMSIILSIPFLKRARINPFSSSKE